MMLVKISWRNIWRRKLRSLTIIFSVIIGITAGTFFMAFYYSLADQRVKSAIEFETSHIQIHHPVFKQDYDIKYFIDEGLKISENLKNESGVRSVTPRFILQGMLATPSGSSGIIINGIIAESEKRTTALNKKIVQGEIAEEIPKNGIIISQKIAKKMKVKLRSKVVLTFQDKNGNIVSGAFRVIALYETVNTPYDMINVFVSLKDLSELCGERIVVNEIAILLNDNRDIDPVAEKLRSLHKESRIEKWSEISPEVSLIIDSMDEYVNIFLVIIMLAISFGVVNIMLMSILERKSEIGMMTAIGMNKVRLFGMILFETIILVMIGCMPGLLISYGIISYFGNAGLDLSSASEAYSSFGYDTVTYTYLDINSYLKITIFVLFTAVLSSMFPAVKALKLRPSESIRRT